MHKGEIRWMEEVILVGQKFEYGDQRGIDENERCQRSYRGTRRTEEVTTPMQVVGLNTDY